MIKGKSYTFFIASTPGKLRKLIVPAYVLHGVAVLALIGTITVVRFLHPDALEGRQLQRCSPRTSGH